MKKVGIVKLGTVLAASALLMDPRIAVGQCWFAKTISVDSAGLEVRCKSSVAAACPECYQEFSTPAYPIRCAYEDAGNRCGGTDCVYQTVNITISYRNGTCYEAGTGPAPQSYDYCYQTGDWSEVPGGTCDNDTTSGTCGSCG
jgi:hypothetical protein